MEIHGADVHGIEGRLIHFEAVKNEKRSGVVMIGLPRQVVREGLQRVAEALGSLEGSWSDVLNLQGYTVSMSPSETPKNSSGLDLPLAIMILQASILQDLDLLKQQIEELEVKLQKFDNSQKNQGKKDTLLKKVKELIQQREIALKYRKRLANNKIKYLMIGTLGIVGGEVRSPEFGMFSMIAAVEKGFNLIVPEDAETHAALIAQSRKGIKAYKVENLQEAWDVILGVKSPREAVYKQKKVKYIRPMRHIPDLKNIDGLSLAKKAMTVAIAGGHNILLVGPAGHGKTMLAKAATALLPQMNEYELLDVNKIYSASGNLSGNRIVMQRPFVQIQSGATEAAVLGSGRPLRPGLVSRAHAGILFFDEINLFNPKLIEQMRTILSDGRVVRQRALGNLEFPAKIIFVAAMNPCKCGWYSHYKCPKCNYTSIDASKSCSKHPGVRLQNKCTCTKTQVEHYLRRISGPMLDRIDLKVLVTKYDDTLKGRSYASSTTKKEINLARTKQQKRYARDNSVTCNGNLEEKSQLMQYGPVFDKPVRVHFNNICKHLDISPRLEDKLMFVSQTLSDLDQTPRIRQYHLDEAVKLMGLDNPYFQAMH